AVPFDREGTLRNAEKLLRQGKLDPAIAEYRKVIEDQPSDWNTANTLGDLYFRAGQLDKAIAQYNDIAAHLANEGFFPKAVALYKKILKIKPDEERAMWHLGHISARQGLLVEARANFTSLADRRRKRGDVKGVAEVQIRLGDLDGADLETRLAGVRARVELGDPKAAVDRLKQYAAELQEKGKESDSLKMLTEAAQIDPEDMSLRRLLVQAYIARSDFDAACQFATSAEELRHLSAELFKLGREDEGINVLASAADADPADASIRMDLVKRLVTRGDMTGARALLTPDVAGNDPELLWLLAEMELRDGNIPEGTALLQKMLADDPSRRDALVILGCSIAEVNPDAGYECIEVAARTAISADEWGSAAAALNEFVNRVPNHIPALMRLVEICVDGGLEATMHSAQAQLADAYLTVGAGIEARVIAEDLVAREPWDRSNIERFRRALALLGETDIDAIIADRLSGQTPFTSTDFMWPSDPGASEMAPMPVPPVVSKVEVPAPVAVVINVPPPPPAPVATGKPESQEVDLNDSIHDMRTGQVAAAAGKPAAAGSAAREMDSVLKGMRDEAAQDATPETAEQHFKLAATYVDMGMQDEAMKALEVAARSPRHRFRAAAMLAKAHLGSGDMVHAIEWYERAVEAPSPSPMALHAVLYELASVLEAHGESARALAVLLELQSEAGDYRDVSSKLEQLKVQMGS
ncbi:MAG TPA: tetratricopeptide repeat protein, partial [Vicinamibacterales bacterium]|nr:tetratricopeptide repeat protein [Vicinamibacterales bacterium]